MRASLFFSLFPLSFSLQAKRLIQHKHIIKINFLDVCMKIRFKSIFDGGKTLCLIEFYPEMSRWLF